MSKLPVVVVGVPYHRDLPAPFVQSLVGVLERSHRSRLTVRVAYAQAPAIHLSRDNLVKHFLGQPDADYLVMVDTDQVFAPETVERLVSWGKPLVAPLIVNRLGDPKPVAFRREGSDLRGMVQYSALSVECWAYLTRFREERLNFPGVVLPLEPDREPQGYMPDAVWEGTGGPLLAVDAVGGGMTCLSRGAAERIDPGPDDRYFDWEKGGEDLSFCRRLLATGYAGYHAEEARPSGIFVDRGCLVGHLTEYARGAVDLGNWLHHWSATATVWDEGDASDLADRVAADAPKPSDGEWRHEPLPEATR